MTILPITYLGGADYYARLVKDDCTIEQWNNYVRQTPMNRCTIGGACGAQTLTIPVVKPIGKTAVRDIMIDNKTDWQTQHWRAIEAAYNSSPFFEYFKDELRVFYEKRYEKLMDFNLDVMKCVLEMLEFSEVEFALTEEYVSADVKDMDLRAEMLKKHGDSGKDGGEDTYYQVFAHKIGFVGGLSIIDLVFNMGMESRVRLKNQL